MKPDIDYSFVTDGGPIYHETMPGRIIVEPWNAYSSLVYLIPVLLLLLAMRPNFRKHGFVLFFALPLLFLGGMGSTLYHAFRSERWLMALDVLPMFLLSLGVAWYFLKKLIGNWYIPLLLIIAAAGLRAFFFEAFPIQAAINIGYFIVGVVIFIPAFLYARKTGGHALAFLIAAAALLSAALFFRMYDDQPEQFMPAGVHWLWHVFSAAGAWMSGLYLIRTAGASFPKKRINIVPSA